MNRSCTILVLIGLLVPALHWAGPAAGAPAPKEKDGVAEPRAWGKENNGLTSAVWTDKDRFKVGEPIQVHYRLKNVSYAEQTVWHSGFWPNNKIVVLDADGKEVGLTEAGRQRRNAFAPGGARDKNVPVALAAGEADTALPTYNLLDFFVLDQPGKYSVQYLYE